MKIAAQINTIREYCENQDDLFESCSQLAKLGFDGIELESRILKGIQLEQLATMLKKNNLEVCSIRSPFARIGYDFNGIISEAKALNCKNTVLGPMTSCYFMPGIPGIDNFLDKAEAACSSLISEGLVPIHSVFDHEFIRQKDGEWSISKIISSPKVSGLSFEVDSLQLARAAIDLADFAAVLGNRTAIFRLSDQKICENEVYFFFAEREICPIGEGLLPFGNWCEAIKNSGAEWVSVGQNLCARDPFDCLARSLNAARKLFN